MLGVRPSKCGPCAGLWDVSLGPPLSAGEAPPRSVPVVHDLLCCRATVAWHRAGPALRAAKETLSWRIHPFHIALSQRSKIGWTGRSVPQVWNVGCMEMREWKGHFNPPPVETVMPEKLSDKLSNTRTLTTSYTDRLAGTLTISQAEPS